MQPVKRKLVQHYGLNAGVAQRLIAGGYPKPGEIRAATNEDLLGLPGFTQAMVDDVREKIG